VGLVDISSSHEPTATDIRLIDRLVLDIPLTRILASSLFAVPLEYLEVLGTTSPSGRLHFEVPGIGRKQGAGVKSQPCEHRLAADGSYSAIPYVDWPVQSHRPPDNDIRQSADRDAQ
jgi:hypothetical protein